MPTATLVPTSLTDGNSNVSSGAYTDVDETIASADGTTIATVANGWTGGVGTGSAFSFGMSDLPATAVSVNTVQFRVRGKVTGTFTDDAWTVKCDVSGTNAPSTTAQWPGLNAGSGFSNRGASSGVATTASVSEVNGWTVRVYQSAWTQNGGADDGLAFEIDCVEIIVDYNESQPSSPGSSPDSGSVSIITSINGLCIAQVRDFVIIGGTNNDRYEIRWCAISDPTDWPIPATADARSKQAGSQSFPTRFGNVTAISSGDFFAYVFQERGVTKMTYVGGDIVFSFDTFEEDRGCTRQGRMVQIDDKVFFQSDRGFHVLEHDQIADIGYGKVDKSYG